ncbi:MAG: hypothetical protein GY757_58215 [bacterium]|nr:hypothetical protein [bacterium]
MDFDNLKAEDVALFKQKLKSKNIKISQKDLRHKLDTIIASQEAFPPYKQYALMVQLLHMYKKTKKKEVIILEAIESDNTPPPIVLGIAAQDWPGMSNAVLGIIHHKERNVSFMAGFTIEFDDEQIAMLMLTFQLDTSEDCETFFSEKKEMLMKIREAVQGSSGKYQFLEDEAVKFEIYNDVVKRFMELYSSSHLIEIIEESGEILKFISSRSREYLEERLVKDLAQLIINNYIYQNMIRSGVSEEIIRIRNLKIKSGKELTGITFVCREGAFSIEDFLMTLNHIVPDHIIKHHKSYVAIDGILVYRIEIVDKYDNPLNARLIKTVEKSMEKLMAASHSNKMSKLKAIGGFEHYARAIIPFLIEELKKTKLTQAFIDVARKTQFSINIKLALVSFQSRKKRIYDLSSKVCMIPGVSIYSVIPTKYHGKVEINILQLKVNLSEFNSIKDVYSSLKNILKKVYGDIRDFDEGFRDIYINILNRLLEEMGANNPALIREIFFNIDELYRIEIPFPLMKELIELCALTIDETTEKPEARIVVKHKTMPDLNSTIVVLSYEKQRRLISNLIKELKDVELYFTQIEWNQRSYMLMVLSKAHEALDEGFVSKLMASISRFIK